MDRVRKARIKKRGIIAAVSLLAIVLVFAVIFAVSRMLSPVKRRVEIEAGESALSPALFLKSEQEEAALSEAAKQIDLREPGNYRVEVFVNGKGYTCILKIADTVAPKGNPRAVKITGGEVPEASAFVTDIEDATDVTVSFLKTPNFNALETGEHTVTLVLTDKGKNQTQLAAKLYVYGVKEKITLEAGQPLPTVQSFLELPSSNAELQSETPLSNTVPGVYTATVQVGTRSYPVTVEVRDTIAPQGKIQNRTVWLGDAFGPKDMFDNLTDATALTAEWEKAPDLSKEGTQAVSVLVKDAAGNTLRGSANLTVKADKEAPKILGAKNKVVVLGDTVSYRTGVTVKDNRDGTVALQIDSSKVNLKQIGKYPVVYTATDKAGNTATVTVTVEVCNVNETLVNYLADEVLAQILKPGMSKKQQCRAIYDWARTKIAYVGTSDKSSVLQGAYEGFTKKRGDCWTYYAVATVMLDRLNIPNMRVDRVGGKTRHFWCLVNVGEGWYHFDCSPRATGHYIDTCLVPDSVLEAYSKTYREGYYNFDHSLYPERGK